MTPSHSKRNSDVQPLTAGFTPGGHIVPGYSYLTRSHSLMTPSRRNVPKGLASPSLDQSQASITSPSTKVASPTIKLQLSSSNTSLRESFSSPRLVRAEVNSLALSEAVAELPPNPKVWTPSQVALYLTHVLGLTPKPIVEDVTAYVRRSRMGGKVFLRLTERDLEAEGLNLKWRKLMIEAVKKLRRDCLRGRIWGFEGGLQWPRQEDEVVMEDPEVKHVPITAQGTLKRLRDKKAIRSMISNFENVRQNGKEEEDGFVALGGSGLRSRRSLTSLHSNESSDPTDNRGQMAPIYGEGFVKEKAESFTSLQDLVFKRKEITKEELEELFGSLSEQETELLVNELQADEELLYSDQKGNRVRHQSSCSDHSSVSGESGPLTPPPVGQLSLDLSPLKPDVIDSIFREDPHESCSAMASTEEAEYCTMPMNQDVVENYAEEALEALPAKRSTKVGVLNLYRSSTYEAEELEALGLHVGEPSDVKWSTAKKISRPPSREEEEESRSRMGMPAANDSTRVKKANTDSSSILIAGDLFSEVVNESKVEPRIEHMRNITALEALGLSPYKPLSPGMSRKTSQKRHGEGGKGNMPGCVEGKAIQTSDNEKATFGRRRGADSMQLAAMLQASGILDGPDVTASHLSAGGKKAEDEGEWGTTVSRKVSRMGTLAKNSTSDSDSNSSAREVEGAAIRMAELFSPAPLERLNASNLTELGREQGQDHLCVPVTTIEATADGKGSFRKRSMILVERKRFESLARRMGVLESQLANLEAASLPSLSDLGSLVDRSPVSQKSSLRALADVFTIPPVPLHLNADVGESVGEERERAKPKRASASAWSIPLQLFGIIPSYALGLGAGVGFVLLSEMLGKSRP
ncbi:hypothetical protein CBS101457_006468 [Exobasidium rhododendri]|nr:hypothetical protein CBS101457_006468 [Exobasidium rhododendri]